MELRFHLDSATWLTEEIKEKFRLKHSITKDGFFIVKSGKNVKLNEMLISSFDYNIKDSGIVIC